MEFTITPRQATIACRVWHYHTMNFILQYSTNSGENSVGVHAGADMARISKCSACQIMWTCNVCQDDTGGVSGGYGSVEGWHGSSSAVMCTWMHGHVKADNNDVWVQMLGCMNSVGQVTDAGGGLLGHGKHVEMGNLDVFSTRCNTLWQIKQVITIDGEWDIDYDNCFGGWGSAGIYISFDGLVTWIAKKVKLILDLWTYMDDSFGIDEYGNVVWYHHYQGTCWWIRLSFCPYGTNLAYHMNHTSRYLGASSPLLG